VALARALAAEPDLLLLDEPFASLDAASRLDLRSELREHLGSFGGASVVVTHDPLDAMVLADRVVVVEAGRAVQAGTPGDLARRPATAYVAALMGLNLYRGTSRGDEVALVDGGLLHAADAPEGEVLVAVRPEAVSLHLERPTGTPRNVWQGTVAGIELLGHRARVEVRGEPGALVDVTPGALAELRLAAGTPVWLSLKATEVEVYAQHAGGADDQQ
jgi:molybdate transport system ATP-binding protein